MGLEVGLQYARSGLSVSAEGTAVVSRNVANAGDINASRKSVNLVTTEGGGVRVASITRASNTALLKNVLSATSLAEGNRAIAEALDQLDATIHDPLLEASPAALVQKLSDALQVYSAAPHDDGLARLAVDAAHDVVRGLNEASRNVQAVRQQADTDIAQSVAHLNEALARFDELNSEIVARTRTGADATDQLDQRDVVLKEISSEIGIRTITRSDNDVVIYTTSGVTLFETRARTVAFSPSPILPAGSVGNQVVIDGVPVSDAGGSGAASRATSGRLRGLLSVRDDTAVTYQRQLDEVARGLVESFSESDQSAVPTLADRPGLFTYPGAPAMPVSATVYDGLAAQIVVNASVDPDQGGVLSRLRDGGISDPGNPAYVYNASGGAGFSDRVQSLIDEIAAPRSFDPSSEAGDTATLIEFGASSAGWLQQLRQDTDSQLEFRETLHHRSVEALSSATGVNIDEQMTLLLELERSYQASTRIVSTIQQMFDSLLAAAR